MNTRPPARHEPRVGPSLRPSASQVKTHRIGGLAALCISAAYLAAIRYFVLFVDYPNVEDPADKVHLLSEHHASLYAMHLISFEFTALALIVVTLALHARMKPLAPFAMQVATAVGLVRAALLLASVMVYNHGMGVVVDLYPQSPGRAAALWQPVETVAEALGGTGGELLGGIWFLLLNTVALRFGALPRVLGWFGAAIGAAGILSVVPALSALGAVFGLLSIVWFLCLGVILLRASASRQAD